MFWYDPARGRMTGRVWSAALSGVAGEPGALGEDTVPVAFVIQREERLVTQERAAMLSRLLPSGDTLQTQRLGEVLALQTVHRSDGELALGIADADGRVVTANLRLDRDGMPERFEGIWTDTASSDRRIRMHRHGRELDTGERDAGRVPLPFSPWTIAEPGMEEALVPLLERLPDDGQEHHIAVFRPLTRSWDNGTVVTRRQPAGMLAVLQFDGDRVRISLLIGKDGDLLFVQRGNEPMTARLPPPGSERAARLEALVSTMR